MNAMTAQIHSIPELIRTVLPLYESAVRTALPGETCRSLESVTLTGCGDSHHAALGAELAFQRLAGVRARACTALQMARYDAESLHSPRETLVIGISVSGEVSRTVEALLLARKAGARTLAMSAAPQGRLARAAGATVDTGYPPFPDPPGLIIPGVRSFVANQVGLLLAAIWIGEARGQLSAQQASSVRANLDRLADLAAETIAAADPLARGLAEDWKDAGEFVFLGGGPNLAAALFCAAKVLEASGDPALGQDLEEWAHLQYFARAAATPTFVISACQRDASRAAEIATAARAIGRRVAVVAPPSCPGMNAAAHALLPLPEGVDELFSPVLSAIPGSLFAAYRAEVIGEPFFRGFGGGRSQEGGGGISRIRTSQTFGLELLDGEGGQS